MNEVLVRADLELLETYEPSKGGIAVPLTVVCGRQDPLIEEKKMRQWINLSENAFNFLYMDGEHQIITEQHENLAHILRQSMHVLLNAP